MKTRLHLLGDFPTVIHFMSMDLRIQYISRIAKKQSSAAWETVTEFGV